MLKSKAPDRQASLVRLMIAVVGMGLLVFTWFRLLQWAGSD
jgi:hypothetical protein